MLAFGDPILVTFEPVPRDELARLVELYLGEMFKFVGMGEDLS